MTTSVVEFRLFDEIYCFNTDHVKYVYELDTYGSVHGIHEAVIGIGKYNKDTMLLIDTAKLYSNRSLDMQKEKSVIVVPDENGMLYGMLVDEIVKLEEVEVVEASLDLNNKEMVVNHFKENDTLVNEICPIPLLKKYHIPAITSRDTYSSEHSLQDRSSRRNYLLFRVGEVLYAIASFHVREVLENEFDRFALPKESNSFYQGAIALRDEVVTLVNFGAKERRDLIVIESDRQKVAFEVDEVCDIEDFLIEKIEPLSENDQGIEAFYNRDGTIVAIIQASFYCKKKTDEKLKQAKRKESLALQTKDEYLIFYIAQERFAISMQYVRQVLESETIAKADPSAIGAEENVAFLGTWNHNAVQVFKLDNYLNNHVNQEENEIVFCEVNGKPVAFLVDSIDNIIDVDKNQVSQMNEQGIFSGAVVYEDEMIVAINPKFLISSS